MCSSQRYTWFRTKDSLRRRGILQELRRRTNRTSNKLTAAVGADETEVLRRTLQAISALESADVGFPRLWWKIPIATLAVGAKLQ